MSEDTQLSPDVVKALRAGRKIEAIKMLRMQRGLDLAQAKAQVDLYIAEHPQHFPGRARVAERRVIQPQSRMHSVNTVPANANSVWMDVERWAREQAQKLRKELEKAKKKAD